MSAVFPRLEFLLHLPESAGFSPLVEEIGGMSIVRLVLFPNLIFWARS